MSKLRCFASVRREFYNKDGTHDGGETEFFYENDSFGVKLRECETLEAAREVLGPQTTEVYGRIEVTEVRTYKGILPCGL